MESCTTPVETLTSWKTIVKRFAVFHDRPGVFVTRHKDFEEAWLALWHFIQDFQL